MEIACIEIKAKTVTTANDVWGKVMFLHLSVILFRCGRIGSPVCITGHMTRGICLHGGMDSRGSTSRRVCVHGGWADLIRSTSGRHTSYRNAFLLIFHLVMKYYWIELKCYDVMRMFTNVELAVYFFNWKSFSKSKFYSEPVINFVTEFMIFPIFIIL